MEQIRGLGLVQWKKLLQVRLLMKPLMFKKIFCHSESDAWIWCPLIQQMNTDILPRSCSEVILS